MVVETYEDGGIGTPVTSPKCFAVRIPGVPKARLDKFLDEVRDGDGRLTRRRAFALNFSRLSASADLAILAAKEVTIDVTTFEALMERLA